MAFRQLLFLTGSFLLGSIPTAFLIARWRIDIDLRQSGSRNVGASNLRATLGPWYVITVGLADVAKGSLPVFLGQRIGMGELTLALSGVAVVAGHNWSPWLDFQGGRGMATTIGVLLVAFPAGLAWVLALLALGALAHQVAFFNGFGVFTLPALSALLGESIEIIAMNFALAALMVAKRLEANQRFEPHSRRIWLTRLLHDRDVY